jgi:hypothetical protein
MNTVKNVWVTLKTRWQNHMPVFFRRMMWVCGLISGTAIAIHETFTQFGIQPHEWWSDIEPYLIGGPIGAMFVCKFTQTYGNDGNPIVNGTKQTQLPPINDSDIITETHNID